VGEDRPGREAPGGALTEAEAPAGPAPRRPDGAAWRNFYGRRHGKKLRPGRRALIEDRLAALAPPGVSTVGNPARRPIDPATLAPGGDLWIEVGFGGGEHLVATAAAHPEIGFVGCEPFVNGVAALLARIESAGVRNVRIHPGDARDLFEVLPAASVGRIYLLFPDPWPKRRHAGRRFVSEANAAEMARLLRPGGELRLATDIEAYALEAAATLARDPAFAPPAPREAWGAPWPGWPGTRYEAKALAAGRRPLFLVFVRR
jgi:tRNA (guanine-N7-)-methyltransferase